MMSLPEMVIKPLVYKTKVKIICGVYKQAVNMLTGKYLESFMEITVSFVMIKSLSNCISQSTAALFRKSLYYFGVPESLFG